MIVVYVTCGSEKEAAKIAEDLVDEKHAACVNFFPVKSVYRWKGKVEKEDEYVLLCKTKEEKLKALVAAVKRLHSYETPAIFSIELRDADKKYLEWLDGCLK